MHTLPDVKPNFTRLHLVNFKELTEGVKPLKQAAIDLDTYADRLNSICKVVSTLQHGVALRWITDWRMYCFERNPTRWADEKFYLLNRSYQFWRGHRIAFTRDELTAIGCDEWDRRVILCGHDEDWVPMEADCFHLSPRRQLRSYVELVRRLAGAVAALVQA
jgi:hypothetical protein